MPRERSRAPAHTSLLWLAAAFAVAAAAAGIVPQREPARDRLAAAASRFLGALREPLRQRAALPLDSPARTDWHFVPRDRPGVSLKEMNDQERAAAHALMRAALSSRGYLTADQVMQLDAVLREAERAAGGSGATRDPERYFFAVFGEPSGEGPWAWRVEGHHLSLNFTVGAKGDGQGAEINAGTGGPVATTPAFFGANPAEVRRGPRAGLRVLARQEELARELLGSLDEGQVAKAIIAQTAPSDILLMPGRDAASLGEPTGLGAAEMTPAQRALLDALLAEFAGTLADDLAADQLARIDAAGREKIRFAWAGPREPGRPHYFRLHGPTFVIEHDNTQNGANHVHSVWRDLERDFGADLLARHYHEDHR